MGANDDAADNGHAEAGPPLTVERLADLQAGLLDNETAAQVRGQVRADPHAAGLLHALNRVRHDVAAAGDDPASAPDVPAEVTAKVSAALTPSAPSSGRSPSSGRAAHSARPQLSRARILAAAAGLCAVLTAIGFGTAALLRAPAPTPSTPTTVEHITVSAPPMVVPLSPAEIVGLLARAPDYGAFRDPGRRASCLSGLGYPAATQVLGARPVVINARPGEVFVLPGVRPDELAVFAVAANCNAADTALLATTQVPRT